MIKTVLIIDLLSYSDISRALENAEDAEASARLNAQIQGFVDKALACVGATRRATVAQTTGDGAKLIFDDPRTAHDFTAALHEIARQHSAPKDHALGVGCSAREWPPATSSSRPFPPAIGNSTAA